MAASVSASASNLPSDPRSGSGPLRRQLSQLRAYTQGHFSSLPSASPASSVSRPSRRSPPSSRSWFASTSVAASATSELAESAEYSSPSPVESTTNPASCPQSEPPTLARDSPASDSPASLPDSGPPGLDFEILELPSLADLCDSSSFPLFSIDHTPEPTPPTTQGTPMARQRASSRAPNPLEGTTPSAPSTLAPATLPSSLLDSGDPVMTENSSAPRPKQKATIRFFPHHDTHQNSRPSLPFIPISRTLPSESCIIRVGRYSERDGLPAANPMEPSDAPVGFKSKVVSRKHCEFLHMNGQWHVKDVGSSSGTFLNHMRLSQPNMASRLYTVKDGDIVQLGIDFRGGEEMIFRCVRIRIECNRSWQQQPNEFNKNTESLIKNLGKGETADYSGCRECSICLGSVLRPYQCLFMAACAHVWHYKCVSRLIHTPDYPMFQCPNCRAYTDLSAEVDDSNDLEELEQKPTRVSEDKKSSDETEEHTPPPETSSSSGSNHDATDVRPTEEPFSTSLPIEAGLAANIEHMRLDAHDEPTAAAQNSPRSTDPSLTTSHSDHSTNLDLPGWQSLARSPTVTVCRQAHLRSDTPVRSESSDDNPLTPLNDSGPLAFDGRAGMS